MVEDIKVKEGYKKTEIGVIPKDWEVKTLGDIGQFKKGKGIARKELTKEGFSCVLYGEIYTKYDFIAEELYSYTSYKSAEKSVKVNKGDLLFTGSGETVGDIGKSFAYLGNEIAYAGGDIILMTPYKCNSAFLGYLTNFNSVNKQKSQLAQGSSVIHIYSSGIKEIITPIPPLAEQKAIAKALTDVETLIKSIEKLINKKKKIKRGTMQQLLTGKKRLAGFSGEWEVKKLGDISDVKGGKRLPKGSSLVCIDTGYPYIRVADMYMGGINTDGVKYITSDISEQIKNYKISKDDLFISVAGTLGIVGCVPEELNNANLTENANKLCNLKCDKIFLMYILLSEHIQNIIAQIRTIGAQPKLALTRIQNFNIAIPPTLEEQKAIAKILSDMDKEIESLGQKLEKYKTIKQGMMQELLTGRIRLL